MLDWIQRNPLVAALLLLCGVFGAILLGEIALGGLRASVPAETPRKLAAAESKLLPPVAVTPPEQAYPESTARPLFTPTRRPAPEVPPTPVQTMKRDQFVLLGVTMAGDTRIAMLREKASGRIHRVERGREVNGMKVAQIERESVTLTQGTESETLSLSVQKLLPGQQVSGAPGGPFGASSAQPAAAPGQPPRPGGTPLMAVPPGQNPAAGLGAQPGQAAPAATPPVANAPAPAVPDASAPMTPEELLARRRARRAQQTQ